MLVIIIIIVNNNTNNNSSVLILVSIIKITAVLYTNNNLVGYRLTVSSDK